MATKEQSLNKFIEKADEVINGKYLFAIKKMEEMLLVVSSSKLLFEIFEYCYNGENLEGLKAKYFTPSAKCTFVMPESEKQAIALCFYVINQITTGEIDFNNFLTVYFPGEGSFLDSYDMFIKYLVMPFRNTVKLVAENVMVASAIRSNREQNIYKPHIDEYYLVGLATYLEEDRRLVVATGLKDDTAKGLVCVIDAMIKCAKEGCTEMLKPLFIAYKWGVSMMKRVKTHYDDVEEMLVDHGILKD